MKEFETDKVRNVALAGHSGAGKTSLVESMLWLQKQTDRLGSVGSGNTVSDYDPEEVRRGHSISASLLPVEVQEVKINVLDLPGRPDFLGEIRNCLRVSDAMVLVIDASAGVEVGARFAWEYCDEFGILPRAAFINKMDKDQADFDKTFAALNETFPRRAVAVTLPVGREADFKGVVDLIKMKLVVENDRKVSYADLPAEVAEAAAEARGKLVESAAEGDEDLMMKFLEDEELTEEEIVRGLKGATLEGRILPIFCGSATMALGVTPILSFLRDCLPSPSEGNGLDVRKNGSEETENIAITEDGADLLFVFKTVSDPYAGSLSFFKVVRGRARSESTLNNVNRGKSERLAHVLTMCGKKHENAQTLCAGDLGTVAKLESTRTYDTLSADGRDDSTFVPTPLPPPTVQMTVVAKSKAEEDKIGLGLHRLIDQDPTLHLRRDDEVRQTILSGMGDVHLDVAVHHLKEISHVEVELEFPRVPYRETITKKAQGQGKYKKQSGGRGQYGDCWIKFEPAGEGTGFEFDWAIVGATIPTKFTPSVEKGLIEAMGRGVLANYPTVDVKATCYDGSFHAVDSSDMAFKVAASMAFKEVMPHAGPIITEPIYKFQITVPEEYMGDIMSDLNSKRGRILGMKAKGKNQVIEALVPLAETFAYSRDLRSITRGSGVFRREFDHYERTPNEVQEKIIAEAKSR